MMDLLLIALAPVLIIALYIYFRDKYEREPIGALLKALIGGMVITYPIILIERYLGTFGTNLSGYSHAAYNAFVIAAGTEEIFKFLALYLLIWRNKNFNEPFDGIVYAVFVSLGFALAENFLYVFSQGFSVGMLRSITAVPAHAIFGITMGYYFALSKYQKTRRAELLLYAILLPILLHGIYDFILFTQHPLLLVAFIPYVLFLWIYGFRKIKDLSEQSRG